MTIPISHRKYEADKSLFTLSHRVTTEKPLPEGYIPNNSLCLYYVLHPLIDMKPNWRFVAADSAAYKDGVNNVIVFSEFQILEGDETLGTIDVVWKGRDLKIRVDNARIREARERGRSYHTDSTAKATLAIRRNFFLKDTEELFTDAVTSATNALMNEKANKDSVRHNLFKNAYHHATAFVNQNIEAYLVKFPGVAETHAQYLEAKAAANLVSTIKDMFDKNQTILVVLTETDYIVRQYDGSQNAFKFVRYTDEDLPGLLRMRIGILKLVQDGQMVSTAGARINKATFIILPESVENAA